MNTLPKRFRIVSHVVLAAIVISAAAQAAQGQTSSPATDTSQAIQNLKSIFKKKPAAPAGNSTPTRDPNRAQPAAAPGPATSSVPSADCCTPEAMKKIASSLGYLDVVGVKLGMTPEQAFAAVKAHNPQLRIDVHHARLQHPTAPEGSFVRVPVWVIAHTLGRGSASNFALSDYSLEAIGLEFTTPPSPPLVAKIARLVQFPNEKPVLLNTLLEGLQKKYGPESGVLSDNRVWAFDANGKPLTRYFTDAEKACDPGNWTWDLPNNIALTGGEPGDAGNIRLTPGEMDDAHVQYERHAACLPFTFVAASGIGSSIAPNSPVTSMQVVLSSPALLRYSQQATHDWLQAELDGKLKQQRDADAKRPAPEF